MTILRDYPLLDAVPTKRHYVLGNLEIRQGDPRHQAAGTKIYADSPAKPVTSLRTAAAWSPGP